MCGLKKKCTDTSVSLTAVMAFDIEMLFMGAARINMDTDPTVGLKWLVQSVPSLQTCAMSAAPAEENN